MRYLAGFLSHLIRSIHSFFFYFCITVTVWISAVTKVNIVYENNKEKAFIFVIFIMIRSLRVLRNLFYSWNIIIEINQVQSKMYQTGLTVCPDFSVITMIFSLTNSCTDITIEIGFYSTMLHFYPIIPFGCRIQQCFCSFSNDRTVSTDKLFFSLNLKRFLSWNGFLIVITC